MARPIAHPPRGLHGRRVALAAGGTAGHVYPALAVAEAYASLVPGVDIVFLGTARGAEARLIPAHGYRLETIAAAPFFSVGALARLRVVPALLLGIRQARRILRTLEVDLVIGLGGYAAAGAVVAGRTLRLPTIIHEANAVAGLANRLLGRLADRVLLGVADAAPAFAPAKTIVTGTPVRAAIGAIAAARAGTRDAGPFRLLVLGGSSGSTFLNRRVPEAVALAARRVALEVRHQTGRGESAPVQLSYQVAGVRADVVPYFDEIADAYRWADGAIACAGAGTLAELAIAGIPALVVPLGSAASDHQSANAQAFAAAAGVWWTREHDWDPDAVAAQLVKMPSSPAEMRAAAARARAASVPDAAAAVVAACEALLAGRARVEDR